VLIPSPCIKATPEPFTLKVRRPHLFWFFRRFPQINVGGDSVHFPFLEDALVSPALPSRRRVGCDTHPMCTYVKSGIVTPRISPTLLLAHLEPKSTKASLDDPSWLLAMQSEYDALIWNDTWTLVDLPATGTTIGCKWVFKGKS